MQNDEPAFAVEYQNMVEDLGEMLEDRLKYEVETRLTKLSKGHTDLTGASVALEKEDKQALTGSPIRARVVVYTRPENIAGVDVATDAMAALKSALTAVERQVREKRDKLRETWKTQRDESQGGG